MLMILIECTILPLLTLSVSILQINTGQYQFIKKAL